MSSTKKFGNKKYIRRSIRSDPDSDGRTTRIAWERYEIIDPSKPKPSDPVNQDDWTKDQTKTKLCFVKKYGKYGSKNTTLKLGQEICIKQRFTHAENSRRTQTYQTKLNLIIQKIREVDKAKADELKTTIEDTKRNTMLAYLNN